MRLIFTGTPDSAVPESNSGVAVGLKIAVPVTQREASRPWAPVDALAALAMAGLAPAA
jgi:hypothetical protein